MSSQGAVPGHRRARRLSAMGDAPTVLQLTRGLQYTYLHCKTRPAATTAIATANAPSTAPTVSTASTTASAGKPKQRRAPASTRGKTKTEAAAATTVRRMLTKKTRPSGNNGLDNEEQNLIVRARDVFGGRAATPVQPEFVVLDLLGQGTFGQVFRCQNLETKEIVAIKVIRNHPSYYKQAIVEVQITRLLNASFREEEAPHFVRLRDTFEFRSHLCIVFELLSINLYELIAENNFNGFPLEVTRGFQQQILHALVRMDEIGVIHCDLKPENILLVGQDRFLSDVVYHNDPQVVRTTASYDPPVSGKAKSTTSTRLVPGQTPHIKVVDFGSACMENETVYSYIQSRFYRSPEVLLGIPYTGSIDLWSLGCIAVEMFLGLPLFPGVSEHDQLRLIEDTLGKLPQELLRQGRNVLRFYNVHKNNQFVLKTPEEFARDSNAEVQISKKYFKYTKLEDMVHAYPHAKHATEAQLRHDRERREVFLHFVRGVLCVDPTRRWSACVAMRHPFITGAQFVREEVEFAQSSATPVRSPVLPLPSLPSVILPQRYEYQTQPLMTVWSSPSRREFGDTAVTPTYSDSIWGPSGMPPYAPGGRLQHSEQLSPTTDYYTMEKRSAKAEPSAHMDVPSSRVYPYDPYSRDCRVPKGYTEVPLAYSPSSAHPTLHCRQTRTHSLASSADGYPVVPVSPYEPSDQGFDSPYYAPPPPPPPQVVGGGLEWPWSEVQYESHSTPYAQRKTWTNEPPERWPRDTIPKHHQYATEQADPPPRRGKRQHTNSWDNGDTRVLRRHEPAHMCASHHATHDHSQYHTPPQQLQQRRPLGSGPSRIQTTPRKNDHHRAKGSIARHRKSPTAASRSQHHQPPQQQRSRRHDITTRDQPEYVPLPPQHHHHHSHQYPAAAKRDESAGVCSVEEKFSSVMSLGISTSAMPLPT